MKTKTKTKARKNLSTVLLRINDDENSAYPQEKVDEIKTRIQAHLNQAVKMGFNLIRAESGVMRTNHTIFFPKTNPTLRWMAETPNVDVGGAICIVSQVDKPSINEVVCFVWNVNTVFVSGFVHGYDMNDPASNTNMEEFHSPRYIQGYWMGVTIAKKYIREHQE